ncbi:hypothetical protein JCM33374_g5935 [Metschnikowia sp. JCM 33374]|nr:hypothetical protein JCM33374_g5935 [Metschnikowia sp. JCM 33374]
MFRPAIRTAQIGLKARPMALGLAGPRIATRLNSSTSASSAVAEITNLDHFHQIIGNKKKVSIVDFYATWCGPCKAIAPIFDALAQKIPEAEFARVDVDRAEDVAREYGITAMPTILFFQEGKKVSTIVGANMPQLIKSIQEYSGVDVKSR